MRKPSLSGSGTNRPKHTSDLEQGLSRQRNIRIFYFADWSGLPWKPSKRPWGRVTSSCGGKASDVVVPDDVATIRRDLEEGCRQLQGFHYPIVLRELQTLSGHPKRLHEWTRAAVEMAGEYA